MSVRTVSTGDPIVNGSGVAQAGISVQAQLLIPAGALALDTAGEVIDLTPLAVTTDNTGTYLFDASGSPVTGLIAPGDVRQYVSGSLVALPGCAWQISYLNTTIISPSFAYSATLLHPSAWAPSVPTLGLFKMYLGDIFGDSQAVQGQQFSIAINPSPTSTTWTGGIGTGQNIDSSNSFPVTTDSAGRAYAYLIRQSELTPSTGYYILTGAGISINFQVPSTYTGDAGSWLVGITYALNDVVRDPATDIPYISLVGSNIGHALTDATKWAPYSGENITAHQVNVGVPGTQVIDASMVSASLTPLIDDPIASPQSVQDAVSDLAGRTSFAWVSKTANYTVPSTVDGVECSGASSTWALTLPAANARKRPIRAILTNATHAVTVTAAGADTINGAATVVLDALYQSATLYPNVAGNGWNTEPAGSLAPPTIVSNKLSADVTMTTANTAYDGPSISLVAGSWSIKGSVTVKGAAGGASDITVELWDGTTVYVSACDQAVLTADTVSLALAWEIDLAATTTVKLTAFCTGAAAAILAAAPSNGAGNNASYLVARRIA